MKLPKVVFATLLVTLVLMFAGACSAAPAAKPTLPASSSQMSMAEMPDFVKNAPASVLEAYQYAIAHPAELEKYPCYCGCGKMGHTSNRSCYIKAINADGSIQFDDHAAGCGICVDITRDVMRMKAEGQSSLSIRKYIDAQYSQFGPGTNTPMVQE